MNLAARLEGLNKMFDTYILMSEAVRDQLNGEFRTRLVGKFRVKGRQEVTPVHELLGPAIKAHEPEWIAHYHRALDALEENNPARALELFTAVIDLRGPPDDGPSRFFIDRLQSGDPIHDGIVRAT